MASREDELYRVASLYYQQNYTMETIAADLHVSRSTVSRMLADARAVGIVQISLDRPVRSVSGLAGQLSKLFRIRCDVVELHSGLSDVAKLARVARVSAERLAAVIDDGAVIGVAWGTTLSAVAENLPHRQLHDVTVVQLNGAVNARAGGLPHAGAILARLAAAFDAEIEQFPVPAFFDYADTKVALWRERSVQRVLSIQARCDVAVFGVGAVDGALPSQVYSNGYLTDAELRALSADGIVGDVCTVLLREDGTWSDIPLNDRASGPTPRALARIPRRFCVAAGNFRAAPLLGALRAGVITDLIVDAELAAALLDRVA